MYTRPIPDDILIMNSLQLRYKLNQQFDAESAAIDLIVGGFDLLSSALSQTEPLQDLFAYKSFLINKTPYFINNMLVPLMSTPAMSEHCVQQAMAHVDPSVFPSMSLGMVNRSLLSDLRQQFLFSCVTHSLIHAESVEKLLGEQPFSTIPDPTKRLVKEVLVEECSSDSEKHKELVEGLEKLDGNAGAISLALAEVMRMFMLHAC
jgi:mediator of RNA polymerase II transcription subunit 5